MGNRRNLVAPPHAAVALHCGSTRSMRQSHRLGQRYALGTVSQNGPEMYLSMNHQA